MDFCARCGVELIKDVNWTKGFYNHKRKGNSDPLRICGTCNRERHRKYYKNNSEKVCKRTSEYYRNNRKKMDEINAKWSREHRELRRKYERNYRNNHREEWRATKRRYRHNHPEIAKRSKNKRKRSYGFNVVVDNNWNGDVHYHHINNNDVIPIPSEFHLLCYTGETEKHRSKCEELINILYEGFLEIKNGEINFIIGD